MNQFLTPLEARKVGYDADGRPVHELLSDLDYWSDRFGLVRTRKGFRTNYASVPRLPVIFLVAGDRAHEEAASHDGRYTLHDMSRADADDLFYEMLGAPKILEQQKNVPELLRKAMYQAVHLFGQSAYDKPSTVWQPPKFQEQLVAAGQEAA